ncbi:hypothetical protein K493DRAFT_8203 [Basidiobolus meristosporus CBS 931.73]|uniref:Uncharacterized protein n=1 Tax=Basidiobolus meristosporus CBS 931.73 TaxID=1314790 RepID=A0A1Y1VUP7_9FUNG|nr:hypothetical protein K493DRAFT_8203 [Basidiobolus meristosporus CBS 931.73]|eukprot:ORX65011.1 hypothetical protein K493DRAFT_8203 [Basidiobolus meristosporus CBS 931.73]
MGIGQWWKVDTGAGTRSEEGRAEGPVFSKATEIPGVAGSQRCCAGFIGFEERIAPLSYDTARLHKLSSFLMCADANDLRKQSLCLVLIESLESCCSSNYKTISRRQ